ncbi:MAG: phosphoglycerate dehydrogenase, partial [Chloroflexi bacterium]|nr:phosphoglycerate dehydrogenase [Chloroflexota bacterium]
MKKRVLVTDSLAQEGIALLAEACEVTVLPTLSREALLGAIPDYHGLVVRSATQVTAEVFAAASQLQVVGRAGTGVDNIDLEAATRRGVIVVNAPTSNTIAVAEHTIALMLSLARHIPQADAAMHRGHWQKTGLMGTELRDKALGLIGLGRVGAAVAQRAQAFEMRVIAHDPFVAPDRAARLNVELVGLEELLRRSDYVSLHAPSTERTRGLIGAQELALMKPTAYLVNCARGDLVVQEALVDALRARRIAGAALDVFVDEPHITHELCDCDNLLLTPHLGASTEEAQSGAAVQVARQVLDVLEGRPPRHPVNVTALSTEEMAFMMPYLDLTYRMGRFYAQFAENNLTHIEVRFAGEPTQHDTTILTASALAGLLSEGGQEPVNLVNVRLVAEERGLRVTEIRTSEAEGFASLVTLRAETTRGERLISGTVVRDEPHIVRIDECWFDFVGRGNLLVSE